MEIKRIGIYDFQSHHQTEIEPAPAGQLTVIVGPSDSGKTAVIRALRWLYFNTPQGTDFINAKTTTAKVAVDFGGEKIIIRERHRKNYNRYQVFNGGKWDKYEGFGNSVPLEIQEITGVHPVTIGDLELNLNLAEQLDGPFLGKSISAMSRAKVLGKMAGAEEVDYAARQLNADLYRRRQDEKCLLAELGELEEQIRQYDYLPALAEKIKALEKIIAAAKKTLKLKEKLVTAGAKLLQLEIEINAAQETIRRWHRIDAAEYALATVEKSQLRINALKRAGQKLSAADIGISHSTAIIQRWSGLEAALLLESKISEAAGRQVAAIKLSGQLKQIETAILACKESLRRNEKVFEAAALLDSAAVGENRKSNLVNLAGRFRQTGSEVKRSRELAALWEHRVSELEGAYKDQLLAAGHCPLCGGVVDIQKLKEVI